MRNQVISLYDYTGEALRPWAAAGYECYAYDIQHKAAPEDYSDRKKVRSGGSIYYFKADLYDLDTLRRLISRHEGQAAYMLAFPPGTDLASSEVIWRASEADTRGFAEAVFQSNTNTKREISLCL